MLTRLLILVIALMPAVASAVATPRGTVIWYECKHIDTKASGVSCEFNQGQLRFRWVGDPSTFPKAKRERGLYEIHRLGLHFMELGGNRYEIRADSWPKDKVRACIHTEHQPFYKYACYDLKGR